MGSGKSKKKKSNKVEIRNKALKQLDKFRIDIKDTNEIEKNFKRYAKLVRSTFSKLFNICPLIQ